MNKITRLISLTSLLALGTLHSYAQEQTSEGNVEPVYRVIQKMPQPKYNVSEYLSNNISYPDTAKKQNIQGQVIVSYAIGTDGYPTHVKIAQAVHPELDSEAVRVVRSMPRWKPGKMIQNGRYVKVPVYFSMPITFRLD